MPSENLTHLLDTALDSKLLALRTCTPARVESYDASLQKAVVLPLLYQRSSTGELITPPPIGNIPVIHPRGGGFAIHLPLQPGDMGLLLCSDRSMDAWLEGNGGMADPASTRHHLMMDAVFLPGLHPWARPIEGASADNLTIGRDTGTNPQITIKPDGSIVLSVNEVKLGSSSASVLLASSAKVDANFTVLSALLATITEPAFVAALATAVTAGWPQGTATTKIKGEV